MSPTYCVWDSEECGHVSLPEFIKSDSSTQVTLILPNFYINVVKFKDDIYSSRFAFYIYNRFNSRICAQAKFCLKFNL